VGPPAEPGVYFSLLRESSVTIYTCRPRNQDPFYVNSKKDRIVIEWLPLGDALEGELLLSRLSDGNFVVALFQLPYQSPGLGQSAVAESVTALIGSATKTIEHLDSMEGDAAEAAQRLLRKAERIFPEIREANR
jgi:hypothetical protein